MHCCNENTWRRTDVFKVRLWSTHFNMSPRFLNLITSSGYFISGDQGPAARPFSRDPFYQRPLQIFLGYEQQRPHYILSSSTDVGSCFSGSLDSSVFQDRNNADYETKYPLGNLWPVD